MEERGQKEKKEKVHCPLGIYHLKLERQIHNLKLIMTQQLVTSMMVQHKLHIKEMQKQKNKLGIRLNGQWESWQTLDPGFSFHSNYLPHKTRYSQYEEYKKVFKKLQRRRSTSRAQWEDLCSPVSSTASVFCELDSDRQRGESHKGRKAWILPENSFNKQITEYTISKI